MKVAFVVANYPPHSGGVEHHVHEVAMRLEERGIRVVVYNCEPQMNRVHDGIEVVGLGRHFELGGVISTPDARAWRGLAKDLRARRISRISVHTRFFPATWLGIRAGRRVGVPVTLTEHGGGPVQAGGRTVRALAACVDRTLGRRAILAADDVMAVSTTAAAYVHKISGRTAAVCGNGIDVAFWSRDRGHRERPHLLYVGRLVPEKGWREFLDLVQIQSATVEATLAGGGPELSAARTEVNRRGLSGRVRVAGPLNRDELRRLYSESVYVNPSRASEGLQTTLLEAAASGARIASYDVGGAAEAREAGGMIEIVPKGDCRALSAATHRMLATRGGVAPRIARFDWEQIVDTYIARFGPTPSGSP